MRLLVEVQALTKRYGSLAALADCSFGVAAGEVFGLLGPNGAGKTTLLRLLLGYLRPTSGRAQIGGLDCYRQSVAVHRLVSYLPGEARLFRQMRGHDALRFFAEVRPGGCWQHSRQLAAELELDLSRRVAAMSTGMRQKLALAACLAAQTPLYVLDEPTSNLDPTMRQVVAQRVSALSCSGSTVIFSSHVLPEVEEICQRVAILRAGRLAHVQVMRELRESHRIVAISPNPLPPLPSDLAAHVRVQSQVDGAFTLETSGPLAPLLGWLSTVALQDVRIEPLGLRRIYDRFHSQTLSAEVPAGA